MPQTPVELASTRAEASVATGFDLTAADEQLVTELEFYADELGFLKQTYFVVAHRGFLVPNIIPSDEPHTRVDFIDGITFEGRFITYSKVHIGKVIGGNAVRAVCLAFDSALLLPYFDRMEEDKLLHVPVLAVSSIAQSD